MRAQNGFTLIELIVVIVILGVLAANAVPKFIDFGSDARESALKGFEGALKGANSMTYAKKQLGTTDTDLGYATSSNFIKPEAAEVKKALDISDADWQLNDATASSVTVFPADVDTTSSKCYFTYSIVSSAASYARPTDFGC